MNIEEAKQQFINVFNSQGLQANGYYGVQAEIKSEDLYKNGSIGYIDGRLLPKLSSKYKVVLDKNVKIGNKSLTEVFYGIMLGNAYINYLQTQQEIGFYMTGKELPNGEILIDNIVMAENNLSSRKASVTEDQVDSIVSNLKAKGYSRPILIIGHTHPDQPYPKAFQNSWSVEDLYSSFCASDRYKNDLQVMSILITPSLDTNLLFYDRDAKQFYRFQDGVYCFDKSKQKYIPEPTYQDISAFAKKRDPNLDR